MYDAALLAIDRDDEAGSALLIRRGAALAAATGCRLHLVHVLTELPRSYLQHMPADWAEGQCKETQSWLRRYAGEGGIADALAGVHAPIGSVAREVVALSRTLAVGCICVAAHHMDLGRLILGNNATAIARDAPCDVLVVRG